MSLPRRVQAELLDTLAPDDPRAIWSRSDLRRINRFMATHLLIRKPLDRILRGSSEVRLVELGAGDGQMLLRIAHRHAQGWPKINLELVDLQPVLSKQTLEDFRMLDWNVEVTRADVFDWLCQPSTISPVIVANLFMHHFEDEQLRMLLNAITARASAFLCCEPRRSRFALMASHLLGLVGCNDVTQHDAVASVHAGFSAAELTNFWPELDGWSLNEGRAGLFSHRFSALKNVPERLLSKKSNLWKQTHITTRSSSVRGRRVRPRRFCWHRLAGPSRWSNKLFFPRRKVCGECIAATNLALLDSLGIGLQFNALAGPELRSVGLFIGEEMLVADLPHFAEPSHRWGRALGREHLDTLLLQRAANVGVRVWQPWQVKHVTHSRNRQKTCHLVNRTTAATAALGTSADRGEWIVGVGSTHRATRTPGA